jgi:hypothetical protein
MSAIPPILASFEITVPEGTLSHKVRVDNGIMLVNREIFPIGRKDPTFAVARNLDIAKPTAPRHIGSWPTRGMHRFTFDGRYVRLARTRWLSRQRRVDHRLPEAGPPRRSRPLVDAGAMDRRRRETHGTAPIIAAIIRCALETAFMSATGTAASLFSASRT